MSIGEDGVLLVTVHNIVMMYTHMSITHFQNEMVFMNAASSTENVLHISEMAFSCYSVVGKTAYI